MRILSVVLILGLSSLAAQEKDRICFDCHRKEGTHLKDLRKCGVCGWMGGSCCTQLCCDTSAYRCKTCGKEAKPNWPAGGAVVQGLQISIKPAHARVKVGDPIDVVVKVTNTTDKAWSLANHAYSHGGFEHHTEWNVTVGGKTITNDLDVRYLCPQEVSHTEKRGTESLAPRESRVFKVRIAEGHVGGTPDSDRKTRVTDKAGEVALQVTEFVLGAASNEIKVAVQADRKPEKGLKTDPDVDCSHEYGDVKDHDAYVDGIKQTCLYAACKKCSHVEHQYTHD